MSRDVDWFKNSCQNPTFGVEVKTHNSSTGRHLLLLIEYQVVFSRHQVITKNLHTIAMEYSSQASSQLKRRVLALLKSVKHTPFL